jgi:hypothetical protein
MAMTHDQKDQSSIDRCADACRFFGGLKSAFVYRKYAVLSSGFPYPADGGRKTVLAGFLDYAVRELGADNVLLVCVSSVSNEEDSASLAPCSVVFFEPGSAMRLAALSAFDSMLLGRSAFQEALIAAPRARPRIAAIFDEFNPSVVLVDTIRMVQHTPSGKRRTGRRHVLYLDDLYSLRYRRMLSAIDEDLREEVDLMGTFGRFLPGALSSPGEQPHGTASAVEVRKRHPRATRSGDAGTIRPGHPLEYRRSRTARAGHQGDERVGGNAAGANNRPARSAGTAFRRRSEVPLPWQSGVPG